VGLYLEFLVLKWFKQSGLLLIWNVQGLGLECLGC
jgi:hypothetical protein